MDVPESRRGPSGSAQPSGDICARVDAAVRPLLESQGFDLVLVEYVGPSRVLRLYIDVLNPTDPMHGVGIEDCSQVSRWVSDLLDAEGISDSIDGAFNLEVSSPGLDRPLPRPKDFVRFVGREVRLSLRGDLELGDGAPEAVQKGRRRFRGVIRSADESASGNIVLGVDGTDYPLRYEWIEQARLVPDL